MTLGGEARDTGMGAGQAGGGFARAELARWLQRIANDVREAGDMGLADELWWLIAFLLDPSIVVPLAGPSDTKENPDD